MVSFLCLNPLWALGLVGGIALSAVIAARVTLAPDGPGQKRSAAYAVVLHEVIDAREIAPKNDQIKCVTDGDPNNVDRKPLGAIDLIQQL